MLNLISRNMRIALLLSFGIHIIWVSSIQVINPGEIKKKDTHTKVSFLGPILQKTAFDIMLESASPSLKTNYSSNDMGSDDNARLNVEIKRCPAKKHIIPHMLERNMDSYILPSLTGAKIVPDLALNTSFSFFSGRNGNPTKDTFRKVIYKGEPPYAVTEYYIERNILKNAMNVLVTADGTVKKTELITTTGNPKIDMLTEKYVKSWMFTPKKRQNAIDEWIEVDVKINRVD